LQIFSTVGEGAHELCALVETHEKEFVLRIGSLEELQGSFLRLTDLVDHAAAEIEDNADGNGDIFGRELSNLQLDIVFEDTKVIWLKPRNLAVLPESVVKIRSEFDLSPYFTPFPYSFGL
jgi:hypothetical protein